MLNLKMITVLLMTGLLAACGGSSKDNSLFDKNTDQNTGESTDNQTDGDVSTAITVDKPRLGTGTGGDFKSGVLDLSLTEISAGGVVRVSANVVDADNKNTKVVSQAYIIKFSSNCAGSATPKAEFSEAEVTTGSGDVSVTYIAKGCVGSDTISAKLYTEDKELKHTATASVNVLPAEVGAINFISSSAPALSINKIANPVLPTNASVTFQVTDKFGDPIADKEVTFRLQNGSGGVELARDSIVTDSSGNASAIVNSGSTHTEFVVIATTLSTDQTTRISTSSQPISVTTGLTRQDRFSISADVHNPGAFNKDGVSVNFGIRAIDAYGNPAPAGTIINFTAESGGISATCSLDNNGSCTAVWTSGGKRPGEFNSSLEKPNERIGMTTILAYTLGEAGFTDKNGDGIFDLDENFMSYQEPYRDDNWDGAYTLHEFFHDTDNSEAHSPASGKYQGALCSDSAKNAGHCENLMQVFTQMRIVQSVDDFPILRVFECSAMGAANCTEYDGNTPANITLNTAGGELYVLVQDENHNMAPVGTTFSVEPTAGLEIRSDEGDVGKGSVGSLDNTMLAGLLDSNNVKEYGKVFYVKYMPFATTGESIKLSADNDGQVSVVHIDQ